MRILSYITTLLLLSTGLPAQNILPADNIVCIASYNVENLFDTLRSPIYEDRDFTPSGLYKWRSSKYNIKVNNIAKIISNVAKSSTDLVVLCEIENHTVVEDLIKTDVLKDKKFDYIHRNSSDSRGIDVALLYNHKFEPKNVKMIPIVGSKFDREFMIINGNLLGENISLILCHMPSKQSSKQKRINAFKTLSYIVDSLSENNGKVIIVGDFNANPTDKEFNLLKEVYSPFSKLHTQGYGSLCYRNKWNMYDMIIVNKYLLNSKGIRVIENSAGIYSSSELLIESGSFKGNPNRTFKGRKSDPGYSDHLPVYLFLRK